MGAAPPSVTVLLPVALRARADGRARVELAGATVAQLIASLEARYPGMRFHLCLENGELRPFVNIFVNGENVRRLAGLDTALPAGARVHILPSVAGG